MGMVRIYNHGFTATVIDVRPHWTHATLAITTQNPDGEIRKNERRSRGSQIRTHRRILISGKLPDKCHLRIHGF